MGYYMATTEERKHMQWCINNGIKISPFAQNTYEWHIDIDINNKTKQIPVLIQKSTDMARNIQIL